ncbi:MAG: VCBS repeat-containing protein [Myxococcales bacterium]|nr:VCBS repeat-containing protein [Myxococcales bacterium]
MAKITPLVSCIATVDGRNFALLGYSSSATGPVVVPNGGSNSAVDSTPVAWDGRGAPQPPTSFAPGVHLAAAAVGFGGTLTWTLGSASATTVGAPSCLVFGTGPTAAIGLPTMPGEPLDSVKLEPGADLPAEPSVAPDAPLNGAAPGVSGGALTVTNTGAATYEIPIAVPAGRMGMQPSIALTYSSQSGNGVAGVGWSLRAASMIARCETSFHSGDTYGYCLDGQRLLGSRPEHDPLTKVTSREDGYLVERANGLKQYYVRSAELNSLDWSSVAALFPMTRAEDPSGNAIRYEYARPTGTKRDFEIRAIHYNLDGETARRHVHFDYEARPDMEGTNALPYPQRTQRLARIRSLVDTASGSELFREYRLTYTLSPTSGRSLLAAVTECEAHGVCKPPLALQYSDGRADGPEFEDMGNFSTNAFEPLAPYFPPPKAPGEPLTYEDQARTNLVYGDFNGDGRLDFLAWHHTDGWWIRFGQSDGRFSARKWTNLPKLVASPGVVTKGPMPVPVDYNMDGRMDLAVPVPGADGSPATAWKKWSYRIYRANDSGVFEPTTEPSISGEPAAWEPILFGDFEGNAYPEYKNGAAFPVPHLVANNGYKHKLHRVTSKPNAILDIDGDGYYEVFEDTGSLEFLGPQYFTLFSGRACSDTGSPFYGDCGSGEKFVKPRPVQAYSQRSLPWLSLRRLGSGRPELLFFTGDVGSIDNALLRFNPSPTAFNPVFLDAPTGLPRIKADLPEQRDRLAWAMAGDVDGDGFDDVILPIPAPNPIVNGQMDLHVYRRRIKTQSDLLAVVNNGLGDVSKVDYQLFQQKIPEPAFQDPECVMPIGCSVRDLWVATKHSMHTQAGAATRSMSFEYAQPRVDLDGSGLLGFKSLKVTDDQTGKTVSTTYGRLTTRESGVFAFAASPTHAVARVPLSASPLRVQEQTTDYEYTFLATGGSVTALPSSIHVVTTERLGSTVTTIGDQTERFSEYDDYGTAALHRLDADLAGVHVTTRYTRKHLVAKWILGLPERTETTSDVPVVETLLPGKGRVTRTTSNEFDSAGRLIRSVREPEGSAELKLTVEYDYNGHGQPTRIRATDLAGGRRETFLVYDKEESLFVTAVVNAAGHRQAFTYNRVLGVPTAVLGANGVVVRRQFDGFGQLVHQDSPKCTRAPCPKVVADTSIRRVLGKGPAEAFAVVTTTTGAPTSEVGVDPLLRVVRSEVTAFDGTASAPTWINYDPIHVNHPVQVIRLPDLTTSDLLSMAVSTAAYDSLGRPTQVKTPERGLTRFAYSGRTETVTSSTGAQSTLTRDELGRVVRSATLLSIGAAPPIPGLPGGIATEQSITGYVYGAFGDLLHIQDQSGNATDLTYDRIGRPVVSTDPDHGSTRTDYDAFGDVVRTVDALGRTTTFSVDSLGRVTATKSPDGLSCFAWDGSPQGVGQLAADRLVPAVAGDPEVSHLHSYDGLGRPVETIQVLDGAALTMGLEYDSNGRPKSTRYPNGFVARFSYTPGGYLSTISDTAGGMLWREGKQNLLGKTELEGFGDGYITSHTYDNKSRLPKEKVTFRLLQTEELEHFQYQWNPDGTLAAQRDIADPDRSTWEHFDYDRGQRLTRWFGTAFDVQFTYDPTGNLLQRLSTGSGVTTATTYTPNAAGGPQPHGLQSSSEGTYAYDATGNEIAAPGRSIEWTAFHLPRKVTSAAASTRYGYDAMGQRVLETQGSTRVRHFGSAYEERSNGVGAVEQVVTIGNGRSVVAQITTGTTSSTRFFHTDHLGSVHIGTSASGAVLERRRYEPFGRQVESAKPTLSKVATDAIGFTGHDNDVAHGLIDMKGRIYDPGTARFLSPDPVTELFSPLGFNRYSYVGNDPINRRDPTGFCADELSRGASNPCAPWSAGPEKPAGPPPYENPDPGELSYPSNNVSPGAMGTHKPAPSPPPKVAPSAANSGSSQGPSPKAGASLLPGCGCGSNPLASYGVNNWLELEMAVGKAYTQGDLKRIAQMDAVYTELGMLGLMVLPAGWAIRGAVLVGRLGWGFRALGVLGGATVFATTPNHDAPGTTHRLVLGVSLLGFGGGAFGFTEGPGGTRLVEVSRWGRPGLQPGDWVMRGGRTRWNYFWSFKWQPGAGNQFAPFRSGESFLVPEASVTWPRGWGLDGWFKGLFGQRRYVPLELPPPSPPTLLPPPSLPPAF